MPRFLIVLLVAIPSFAVGQIIRKAPSPKWLTPVAYNPEAADTLHSGGQYYLLSEGQYHGEKKESFYRYASKALTESGLENISAIQVNYDPSYQQLTFNSILVWRSGKSINKLPDAKFEILRREENLDRLIYDKSIDVIYNVEDVQVGDIVEYSYTVAGRNPVFEDKIFRIFYTNYTVPVGKSYDRFVCREGRQIEVKTSNNASSPHTETKDGITSYEWERDNVPALPTEDGTPYWYNAYDKIEISEYKDWSEISRWALPLYSTKDTESKEIDSKITEIKNGDSTVEAQVTQAIRFVQDQVRYLSFSGGIQGYKPHNPAQVFKQRFGDCKDKSLLLVFMLTKLGIESYPALVNTSFGKSLGELLPSPTVFDHCIVQLKFQDTTYWVDPTLTLERGSFRKSSEANYHRALVISSTTSGLQPIEFKNLNSKMKVDESYSFKMVGGTATLTVKTVFEGSEANTIRNYYKSNSAEQIKKSYTNFYANDYSEISMVDYVKFEDDLVNNVVTSTENYELENFWQYDSSTSTHTAELYARVIAQQLSLPSSKSRKYPLAVTYPTTVDQNIFVYFPESWNITEKKKVFSSPAFRYSSEVDYVDRTLKMYYKYVSLGDHVTAAQSKSHINQIEKASDDLNFQLSYSNVADNAQASSINVPYLVIALMIVPLMIIGLRRLYFYDPRSRDYLVSYDQVGGWLILPAIGIFLSPISLLARFLNSGVKDLSFWEVLSNSGSASYNPSLGLLYLVESVILLLSMGYYILLIVLLIRRRTSFPNLIIIALAINVIYLAIETSWLYALDVAISKESISSLAPIFSAAIWIPYFIYSERVKGTFTERVER